jgi:hypothetical protein
MSAARTARKAKQPKKRVSFEHRATRFPMCSLAAKKCQVSRMQMWRICAGVATDPEKLAVYHDLVGTAGITLPEGTTLHLPSLAEAVSLANLHPTIFSRRGRAVTLLSPFTGSAPKPAAPASLPAEVAPPCASELSSDETRRGDPALQSPETDCAFRLGRVASSADATGAIPSRRFPQSDDRPRSPINTSFPALSKTKNTTYK